MSGPAPPPDSIDLGDLSRLADGEMRAFAEVGDNGIVVCRVAGTLYAVEDNCSHADTPLSEGRLRGAMLVCPLHGAAFDVRDGSHHGPPAWTGIACYRVLEDGATARVEVTGRIERDRPNQDVGGRFEVR